MHIDPTLLRLQPRHVISPEEINVAESAVQSHITPRQTATMVHNRTGHQLDWRQVDYVRRKKRGEMLAREGNITSADKLAAHFESPGVSSVCLYAEYNSNLLTIKQKQRASNGETTEESSFDCDLGDVTETPEMFARSLEGTLSKGLRDNLTDSVTGEILLLAVWTNDTARLKLDKWPEFLSADDTEGTNAEERPLHDWCGKDGENEIYPALLSFLPSKSQWSYTFVLRAAKLLIPGTALSRVVKINTDQDHQETRAICNAIGKKRKRFVAEGDANSKAVLPIFKSLQPGMDSIFSVLTSPSDSKTFENAQQDWYGFHKINRNFTHSPNYKSILDAAKDKDIFGRLEIDIIVRWMWYFIKYYKTKDEVELSAYLFHLYMTEDDQSGHITKLEAACRSPIVEYICKSFFINSEMLFESCFEGMTMEEVTTSINESWHRATKRVAGGPQPGHDLGMSAQRIDDRTKQNEHFKAKKAAFDTTSMPAKGEDRKVYCRGLSRYCNKKIIKDYKKSSKNEVFRFQDNQFYVKRNYELYPTSIHEDIGKAIQHCSDMLTTMNAHIEESTDHVEKKTIKQLKEKLLGMNKGNLPQYQAIANEAMKYVIPRFERTHIVKIETMSSGEKVLTCGNEEGGIPCAWMKHGRACEHIYRLLNRTPQLSDAHVRWHNGYAHMYGRNEIITQHYIHLRDNLKMPGVPITDNEASYIQKQWAVGTGTKNENFFTRSLSKLYVCGENTYWHKIRHRLPRHIQECIPSNGDEVGVTRENDDDDDGGEGGDIIFDADADADTSYACNNNVNGIIHRGSQYMVPSQLTQYDGPVTNNMPVPPQGTSLKSDFMPIYETLCKMADGAGPEGHRLMEVGLNNLRQKQLDIIAGKKVSYEGGDNAYSEFMHLYESTCSCAEEAGPEGLVVMREGLNMMKREQVDVNVGNRSNFPVVDRGMASLPATNKKKVDKRIQSRCSPRKK